MTKLANLSEITSIGIQIFLKLGCTCFTLLVWGLFNKHIMTHWIHPVFNCPRSSSNTPREHFKASRKLKYTFFLFPQSPAYISSIASSYMKAYQSMSSLSHQPSFSQSCHWPIPKYRHLYRDNWLPSFSSFLPLLQSP